VKLLIDECLHTSLVTARILNPSRLYDHARSVEKRAAIEGPISIPLRSSLFLLNVLAFPNISLNSSELHPALLSIPTAPTKSQQTEDFSSVESAIQA
jgi:hypothetical protein